ncbi:hypothetical protein ES708_32212 [subsurface metagenome]
MNLGQNDNGMLVFDSDEGVFYFWYNNNWIQISMGTFPEYTAGEGISIGTDNVITNALPDQVIMIAGEGATTVTGIYPNFTITSDPDDADADSTNELITYGEIVDTELLIAEGEDTVRIDVSILQDNGWDLTGNAGTNPAMNYLGTSDNVDLSIRTGGIEKIRLDDATGNVGIGISAPQQPLHVNGNIRADGNLQLAANGYIDDDAAFGGNGDDWIRLNGYIEMKSNSDNYGILLRDTDNNEYFGLTQVNGYSYLSDNTIYNNYFLRGNGGDAHIRYNLTAGRQISSGNGYDVVSNDFVGDLRTSIFDAGAGILRKQNLLKLRADMCVILTVRV